MMNPTNGLPCTRLARLAMTFLSVEIFLCKMFNNYAKVRTKSYDVPFCKAVDYSEFQAATADRGGLHFTKMTFSCGKNSTGNFRDRIADSSGHEALPVDYGQLFVSSAAGSS
jgi:hypothetical protein